MPGIPDKKVRCTGQLPYHVRMKTNECMMTVKMFMQDLTSFGCTFLILIFFT